MHLRLHPRAIPTPAVRALLLCAAAFVVCLLPVACGRAAETQGTEVAPPGPAPGVGVAQPRQSWADNFDRGPLDETRWVRTSEGDFREQVVEVVDGRLRMAADTVGTDDKTVKYHGVRTRAPVATLEGDLRIRLQLDWNDQANGSYMSAGLYLCPTESENPRTEATRLEFRYIGVPPGRNARAYVMWRRDGMDKVLLTEDWPQNKEGRKIGRQDLEFVITQGRLTIVENGKTILEGAQLDPGSKPYYLYLQHSSHSNYRLRDVFFDNVAIIPGNGASSVNQRP